MVFPPVGVSRRAGGEDMNDLDEIEHMVATAELTAEQRRPLFWAIRKARELQHDDERIEEFRDSCSNDFTEDEL
jgi:hypothetical protein